MRDIGFYIIAAFVIAVMVLWSFERNAVWHSELSLCQDIVKKSPNKTRALVNLAIQYRSIDDEEHGVKVLERAIELDPNVVIYLEAVKYAHEHGGRLKTEKDMWNQNSRTGLFEGIF